MSRIRNRFLIASAAAMALALPQALLAGNPDQGQRQQQTTANAQDNQSARSDMQSQDNQQQDTQQAQNKQDDQNRQTESVRGEVQNYREVNIDGTEHFRARVKAADGSIRTVDFGPSDRNANLIDNIEEGDHISVQGQATKMNGKPVIVADEARLAGQTYQIAQANQENQNGESEENANNGQENAQPGSAEARNTEATGQENNQENNQQPNALVLLNERFVFVDEGDLNRHLILAKEALRMGDKHAAAGELLVAAERLSLYTNGQAGKQATDDLDTAKQDLQHLADQISRKDSNVQPKEIDQAASRAQAAMATLFADRVQHERGGERTIEAGYDLQSAAVHAREALLWSDQNVPDNAAHSIRQAMQTADDLITGNGKNTQQADKVEQTLAKQIDQFDQGNQQEAQPAAAEMPGKENQSDQKDQNNRQDQNGAQEQNKQSTSDNRNG